MGSAFAMDMEDEISSPEQIDRPPTSFTEDDYEYPTDSEVVEEGDSGRESESESEIEDSASVELTFNYRVKGSVYHRHVEQLG